MPDAMTYERLVRVVGISADGSTLIIRTRSDDPGQISGVEPGVFHVGDLINVRTVDDRQELQLVDPAVWPLETKVGTVLHVDSGYIVVEVDLRAVLLRDPGSVEVSVGNTVAVVGQKVVEVLTVRDLSRRSGESLNGDLANRFERTPDESMKFESFGGADQIVRQARDLVEVSLAGRRELEEIGARPIRGILFTGPPGTGKTHLARILAAEARAAFFEISGPQVFSKWFGESEELIRQIFKRASERGPSIIFFDEIDAVAGRRSDNSHEASKRVVAQLLTEMDGFASAPNVLVVAATNRPEDLDEALLRPGRFDRQVTFTLPDLSDRMAILRTSGQSYKHSCTQDLPVLAKKTDGWSPAELASIWVEAAHVAVRDRRKSICAEDLFAGKEAVEMSRIHTIRNGSGRKR